MDNYILAEINEFSQRENGYLALFCVRLGNFCVKADPQAMLPATIRLESAEYNFEDVAEATRPNDYTFDVTPKNENSLKAIIQGVAEVHPEFKVSVKIKEYDGDLLNDTCKTFHKECVAKLEWAYDKRLADTAQLLTRIPIQDADNAKKVFEKTYNDAKENAEKLLNAKLQEIEEGYQRYLAGKGNTWENSYKDDTEIDVSSLI